MDDDGLGCFLLIVVCIIAVFVGWRSYINGIANGRNDLANQIATGTHEVVWSTNEFGTLEVRIVEKEKNNDK